MERIRQTLRLWVDVIRSRIQIILLQREINRLKMENYDALEASAQGLRHALETQDRSLVDLHKQLEIRDALIKQLQAEYATLTARAGAVGGVTADAERLIWFKKLQPIATQLATLRAALAEGAPLTAQDALDAIAPLDEALDDLGFERIGQAGLQVAFDPTRHRAVGRGARHLSPNDLVRVRYVGYSFRGNIVSKAEVIRAEQGDMARTLN